MKSIFDLDQYEAVIVVHESDWHVRGGKNEKEVIATIPFYCQYDELEEFEQNLSVAVEGLKRAYAHHPDAYLSVTVIRRHNYVNMS